MSGSPTVTIVSSNIIGPTHGPIIVLYQFSPMLVLALSVVSVVCVISIATSVCMYQQVRSMREQLMLSYTNSSFDCLTRAGFRLTWKGGKKGLIFMDLDHMHGLNSLLGYARVDELIKRVLSTIRITDNVLGIGQWMSGDEFGIICRAGDEIGLATRMCGIMREITVELRNDPVVMAKHVELMLTDSRYGMTEPTFAATYGCIVTSPSASLEAEVNRASAKVQLAKANNDRGTVN